MQLRKVRVSLREKKRKKMGERRLEGKFFS